VNRIIITSFLLIVSIVTAAQKAPVKFGDISPEEIKMKSYDRDTSAAALVLADYGTSTINYNQTIGWSITFNRIRRVKIFKKEGFDDATMNIRMYRSSKDEEKLSGLKAATYTLENGKIVTTKMQSEQIFREKTDDNTNTVRFTLPNIKEGCVIDIAYTITSSSAFLFNFRGWQFQEDIPVKWSEYHANIPEYFTYNKYSKGYIPFTINETKKSAGTITPSTTTHTMETENINYEINNDRWAIADVPAFKTEPKMNNYRDYIASIHFELAYLKMPNSPVKQYMDTWESLNAHFLQYEDFGLAISGSGFLNKTVEDITEGISDPKEKLSKIYSHVKNQVAWDETTGIYTNSSFRKILDAKKGGDADINLLLVSMLQKAGLEAAPVLISTRNHGFVRVESPLSSQFNYVICKVSLGDGFVLLDATDRSLPITTLPKRCLNGQGFVVSEKNSGWVPITSTVKSKTTVYAELLFMPDGKLEGKVNYRHTGYNAQEIRQKYYSKGEEKYVKELSAENHWDVQKSAFENLDKISEAATESYSLSISEPVQSGGQGFFFNPLFDNRIDENPFKSETREYPVDFANPSEESFTVKITVPEQFTIDEVPKSKILTLPDNAAKFVYNVASVGNSIIITSGLSINKSLFAQTEYPSLREFYSQVVAKQQELVVLKKK